MATSTVPREATGHRDTDAAILIYPHQLFHDHPALGRDRAAPIYLVEDPLIFTQYRFHPLKIRYHRLSMAAYARYLEGERRTVRIVRARELPSSGHIVSLLGARVGSILVADLADDWLSRGLHRAAGERGIAIETLRSPGFLLGRDEITEATGGEDTLRLAPFYRHMRLRHAILIDADGAPIGGRWSFDTENRKKIPSRHHPPPPRTDIHGGEAHSIARELAGAVPFTAGPAPFDGDQHGDGLPPYPFTRDDALAWLEEFLSRRLPLFGVYEDAVDRRDDRWYHSVLTPMLNAGIITPGETLRRTMEIADRAEREGHPIPLNSLEGFVRQILGWREFMRAAYHLRGRGMRSRNAWGHTRAMPSSFYNGTTGLPPFDRVVRKTIRLSWAHHIERLMIAGNLMLLSEIDPDAVYRWFMEMYVDAYDWVMVPNVYAMSQYADGGTITTKPYISGSNYIRKMSDEETGPWQEVWDGLYWRFIDRHRDFFAANRRSSMMVHALDRLDRERKARIIAGAEDFLAALD